MKTTRTTISEEDDIVEEDVSWRSTFTSSDRSLLRELNAQWMTRKELSL